jgi:DNA polymerase III subunit epsilon
MYAIVDIETCGGRFSYPYGRIIDICVIIYDGEKVIDQFTTLLNPQTSIGSFYTEISGISNAMVMHAPTFAEVAQTIKDLIQPCTFVAHNVSFDYNFIKGEFNHLGIEWNPPKLCTVQMSRKLMPGYKSYSLGKFCAEIGIEIINRHRAEGDAVATAELFSRLLKIQKQSIETPRIQKSWSEPKLK